MNTTRDNIITYALTPFSWIYWLGSEIRNKMFNWHILKSERFDVPVICVGNLSVGGTGKTPHVEYILSLLQSRYRIGVVSRGYKRLTKGFVLANTKSTPETIGDEPYQIFEKFGRRVRVAVCEKRAKGIHKLLEIDPKINLILLDDAFQHRYVDPSLSIMLMDYSRPVFNDDLLPLGQLREDRTAMNRADIVMVTKCPDNLREIQKRVFLKNLKLMPYQSLFFSQIKYQELRPVFNDEVRYDVDLRDLTHDDTVLLVVGVANPRPLVRYCTGEQFKFKLRILHFPDHHNFTEKDLQQIQAKYKSLKGARKIILTTEKDAGRLLHNPYYPQKLKSFTFCIPIMVDNVAQWTTGDQSLEEMLVSSIEEFNRKKGKKMAVGSDKTN